MPEHVFELMNPPAAVLYGPLKPHKAALALASLCLVCVVFLSPCQKWSCGGGHGGGEECQNELWETIVVSLHVWSGCGVRLCFSKKERTSDSP